MLIAVGRQGVVESELAVRPEEFKRSQICNRHKKVERESTAWTICKGNARY